MGTLGAPYIDRIFALIAIIHSQSAHYFLRAAPILDKRFMQSAATQAKRREMISSKEIEIARRAEFAKTTLVLIGLSWGYRLNGTFRQRSPYKTQSQFPRLGATGGASGMVPNFAKTHL